MGCRNEYLAANASEVESVAVCKLLIFVFGQINQPVPSEVTAAANSNYGDTARLHEHTALLCATCTNLSDADRERIIYDAHNPESRTLATWWEHHQEVDRQRIADEQAAQQRQTLVESAKSKLTPEELSALQK